MADNMFLIEMNYKAAMEKAAELERVAGNLENLSNEDLNGVEKKIRNNWEGENAGNYLTKVETAKSNVSVIAKQIRKLARTVREIAKTTRDAEIRAQQLAKKRTYLK